MSEKKQGVTQEQIDAFLADGGRIKRVPPRDDRFSIHTSHFHYGEGNTVITAAAKVERAFRCRQVSAKRRQKTWVHKGVVDPFGGSGNHARLQK